MFLPVCTSLSYRRAGLRTQSVRGFTLIELLAVIGILSVVLAILVPLLVKARHSARQVVCLNRLKDLTLASTMYFTEYQSLPEATAIATGSSGSPSLTAQPHSIDTQLLGRLQKYMKYPAVTIGTQAKDLPPSLQCPFLEAEENDRGPFATLDPTEAYFYTGYSYVGRIEEPPVPPPTLINVLALPPLPPVLKRLLPLPPGLLTIQVGSLQVQVGEPLKPERIAKAKPTGRQVVWADDVHWEAASGGYWQYGHLSRSASAGPKPLTRKDTKALAGQHRAFIDGSVEWVPREEMGVEPASQVTGLTINILDGLATFKIGTSSYWWF